MNYYYCTSKWEHAVIEARKAPNAKRAFMEIINSQLEKEKQLQYSDIKAVIVNVYKAKSIFTGT